MKLRPCTESYNVAEKDMRYNKNRRGLERMKVLTILKCATVYSEEVASTRTGRRDMKGWNGD